VQSFGKIAVKSINGEIFTAARQEFLQITIKGDRKAHSGISRVRVRSLIERNTNESRRDRTHACISPVFGAHPGPLVLKRKCEIFLERIQLTTAS